MSSYRYPAKSLMGDYLRAGGGLAVTGGPVLFLPTAIPVAIFLGSLSVLFGIFGLRTALRQFTVIETTEDAISVVGAGGKRLPWREVRQLRLDYYSTRRDSQGGWMQMRISGSGGHIRIDSTLDRFSRLAAEVCDRAARHEIEMTSTTRGNFRALGIPLASGDEEAGR
jgi:hypothetical protein